MKKVLLSGSICLFQLSTAFAFSPGNEPATPAGYVKRDSAQSNIRLFQKSDGSDTYVQVIDIAGGATVRFQQYQTGTVNGEPQFETRSEQDHWNAANFSNKYSMINGQFFAMSRVLYAFRYNTTLSFGVRSSGSVLTYGAAISEPIPKKILVVQSSPAGVHVHPYSPSDPYWLNLGDKTVQTAIVGADTTVDKSANDAIGRTFLCTAGGQISPQPWLVTLSSSALKRDDAIAEIGKFKCNAGSMIQMDGSGSTKFVTTSGYRVSPNDSRTIPQAIVFTNK